MVGGCIVDRCNFECFFVACESQGQKAKAEAKTKAKTKAQEKEEGWRKSVLTKGQRFKGLKVRFTR